MDNMHTRMRNNERDLTTARPAAVGDDMRRYAAPRPPVEGPRKRRRRFLNGKVFAVLAAVIVLGIAGFGVWQYYTSGVGSDGIDHSKYQAVFLSNGTITNNVYFGKLERISDGYYRLTDAFYIKAAQTGSGSSSASQPSANDLTLAKLGATEIYGPEDTVIIPREQVLYYQNMRSDSKIVQAINKYNSANKTKG